MTSQLEDLPLPEWEFCRLMGNIIDNAIDALEDIPTAGKLTIEIFEELKSLGFRISNNGPPISDQDGEKLFKAGFSTKAGRGDGMGLYISQAIVAQYQGELAWKSTAECTLFEVWFFRPALEPEN